MTPPSLTLSSSACWPALAPAAASWSVSANEESAAERGPPVTRPEGAARAAIEALFREHHRDLVRFLRVRVSSESEASDLAQEAYLRLLQVPDLAGIAVPRAYLFKIAQNLVFERGRRSEPEMVDIAQHEELADSAAPDRSAAAAQELRLLQACLEELPGRCALAFRLHRLVGMESEEVAATLDISERMVRRYVLQALLYLQLRLDGATPAEAREGSK